MKKILIAVDDTKGTKAIFSKSTHICKCMNPEEILLLYVERLEGRSLVNDVIDDIELSILREVLEGTEFKEALDKKANTILNHYKSILEETPPTPNVKTILKSGHPAEEILRTATEEGVDMIIVGSRGKRSHSFLMGSISREVVNSSEVPVLIVK